MSNRITSRVVSIRLLMRPPTHASANGMPRPLQIKRTRCKLASPILLTHVILPRSMTTLVAPSAVIASTALVRSRVSSPPVRFRFGVRIHTPPNIVRSRVIPISSNPMGPHAPADRKRSVGPTLISCR